MPTYQWAGLTVTADFALSELPVAKPPRLRHDPADAWRVRRLRGVAGDDRAARWFHQWPLPDGRVWLAFAHAAAGGYLLRFPRLADFHVRPDLRQIAVRRHAATPAHTLRHLLLDQVLPLVAGARDCLALHASVVNVDGGAVAFLGAAREGKSTLAAAISRRGHAVVSDDCCVVRRGARGFEVSPTYPGVRLFPESRQRVFGSRPARGRLVSHYSHKRRVADDGAARFRTRRIPLRCVYTLPQATAARAAASRVRIACRTQRESLMDLVGGTFLLDVSDAARTHDAFTLAADVASSTPVRSLSFPWDLGALDEVVDRLLDDVRR